MGKCLQEILDDLPVKERKIDFEKKFIVYGVGEVGESFFYGIESNKSWGLLPNKDYISYYIGEEKDLFKSYKVYNKDFLKENYANIKGQFQIVIAANVIQCKKIECELVEYGYEKDKDFFRHGQILRKIKLDKEFFQCFVDSDQGKTWLEALEGPLFTNNSVEGQFVKRLMLTDVGKKIRSSMTKYRPICIKSPAVLSDGRVELCVKGTMGDLTIGDLYKESVQDIVARKDLKMDLYDYVICRDCIGKCDGCTSISLLPSSEDIEKYNKEALIDSLQIEVFSGCNYQCTLCIVNDLHKYRNLGALDLDRAFESLKEMLPKLKRIDLYNHGEPLLNKDLGVFVKKCRAIAPSLYIAISTNAMHLTKDIAQSLIDASVDDLVISVHGAPSTEGLLRYAMKNANYEYVLNNVKQLIELRGEGQYPKIRMKSALFDWNDTDEKMQKFRDDAKEIGLNAIGDSNEGYYWVPNMGGNGGYDQSSSSKKYLEGSKEVEYLINRGEYRRG